MGHSSVLWSVATDKLLQLLLRCPSKTINQHGLYFIKCATTTQCRWMEWMIWCEEQTNKINWWCNCLNATLRAQPLPLCCRKGEIHCLILWLSVVHVCFAFYRKNPGIVLRVTWNRLISVNMVLHSRSPRWTSGSPRMLLVLICEFESRRGDILNIPA